MYNGRTAPAPHGSAPRARITRTRAGSNRNENLVRSARLGLDRKCIAPRRQAWYRREGSVKLDQTAGTMLPSIRFNWQERTPVGFLMAQLARTNSRGISDGARRRRMRGSGDLREMRRSAQAGPRQDYYQSWCTTIEPRLTKTLRGHRYQRRPNTRMPERPLELWVTNPVARDALRGRNGSWLDS